MLTHVIISELTDLSELYCPRDINIRLIYMNGLVNTSFLAISYVPDTVLNAKVR